METRERNQVVAEADRYNNFHRSPLLVSGKGR